MVSRRTAERISQPIQSDMDYLAAPQNEVAARPAGRLQRPAAHGTKPFRSRPPRNNRSGLKSALQCLRLRRAGIHAALNPVGKSSGEILRTEILPQDSKR